MKNTATLLAAGALLAGCATQEPYKDEVEEAVRQAGPPKQIIDPVHGPNFGPHPIHGTADPSTYLPK